MFLLRLFGHPSLEDATGPLSGRAAQRRRLALLAILALEHPRAVSRDKLIAWFWPEHDTERARHLLRDSIYLLRVALPDAVPGGDELRLNAQCIRCDVWEFEEAIALGRPEEAVHAYAGPLLDAFHVSGAPDLAYWLDAERARFARTFATALETLAEDATANKEAKNAAEWWRRLAATDPYNSRIALRLMEALEAAGDRAAALQQARIHATLLEQEFGAEPDPEVIQLAERLRASPVARVGAGPRQGGERDKAHPRQAGAEFRERPAAASMTAAVDGPHVTPRSGRRLSGSRRVVKPYAVALGFLAVLPAVALLSETSVGRGAVREGVGAGHMAIAVLPCTNLSGDPEQEAFSDGLTEELTGMLAQAASLRVAARTSAFAFKGGSHDVREIGRSLGVGTLLECSVRREGERVRVSAQLINAADGFHLWAETYERAGTDVFAIQSDLAVRIVDALQVKLTPAERKRIARRPTQSPLAHTLYLKGRYFWNKRTSIDFTRAIEHFERAIEIDPRYAQAHAGLAYVYSMQGLFGDLTPEQASVRTRDAALRALELDPDLAEAYTVLGGYHHVHAWDSEASERAHLRAIELDPSYSTGRHWYGNLLASLDRFDEAIAQKWKAVELDPLTPHLSNSLGGTLLVAGRPLEALGAFRNALDIDSTYWAAHAGLGDLHAATGQMEKALHRYRRAVELAGDEASVLAGLARTLALAGRDDEARVALGVLQAEAVRTGVHSPAVAFVFVALDDVDAALAWLERSYQQRHPELRFIGRARDTRLANDPRFLDLRRRIGLPP